MKAATISRKGGPIEWIERAMPVPAAGEVRIQVKACGVCHSDLFTKEGAWPGVSYPRSPGHEIAGVIESVGTGVTKWKTGQRVGVGWTGGYCGECLSCRRGDYVNCEAIKIPGIHFDGGYAEFIVAPAHALAQIPDALSFEEAAPILCAGITTFNALRKSTARPPALVAILGIGGLGHLGIQFAQKMGFKVVAISKGSDKEGMARRLGAHEFIDTGKVDGAARLKELGGARIILATAPNAKAMTPLIDGLGPQGELIVVGASMDPIQVSPIQLIGGTHSVRGWPSGSAIDCEEALAFCALTGVRAQIETVAAEKAAEGYDRMMSGDARFRVVLKHR